MRGFYLCAVIFCQCVGHSVASRRLLALRFISLRFALRCQWVMWHLLLPPLFPCDVFRGVGNLRFLTGFLSGVPAQRRTHVRNPGQQYGSTPPPFSRPGQFLPPSRSFCTPQLFSASQLPAGFESFSPFGFVIPVACGFSTNSLSFCLSLVLSRVLPHPPSGPVLYMHPSRPPASLL